MANKQDAMNRYKSEAASKVGVPLKQGYNGDITARQAGSIGGQMVKTILDSSNIHSYKTQAASEVGVTLKPGYNGDLTSKEAGSIGGQMVKRVFDSLA